MATFRVWCRIEELEERKFLASVATVPVADRSLGVHSQRRVTTSRLGAKEACALLASKEVERLKSRGHEILVTHFE